MTEVVFGMAEEILPGYYRIPGFSRHLISAVGKIIDKETQTEVSQHKSTGYMYSCIYSDVAKRNISVGVHRLMALAFCGPKPHMKSIPNHIDGVKDNNVAGNIQWTNYTGNILHAYQTGLRTDNRPILAKDLRDGSITRYYSASACASEFGVSSERIWRNVRDNTGNIYFNYYVFRYEDDERPWPNLNADDIGKINNGEPKPALAYCLSDGVILIAGSISELSKITGVKAGTIAYAIGTGRQYPVAGYLFKQMKDPTPWNKELCEHYRPKKSSLG